MAVKFNPSSIGSGLGYATQINQLFSDVQSALQDAVSRTGNGPNAMSADLDLGTNDLLNVGTANLQDLFIEGSRLGSLSEMQSFSDSAEASATEAENWANRAEDDLVPEGDGVDDYSALHWARKAEGFKDDAEAAVAGVSLPSVGAGDADKMLRVKDDESGYELANGLPDPTTGDNNKIAAVNTAEDGYELKTAGEVAAYLRATTAQAEAGTSNATVMTPLRTQEWLSAQSGTVKHTALSPEVYSPERLVLESTQSSVTEIDFPDVFEGGEYENYRVRVNGLTPDTGADLYLTFTVDSGSTYDTSSEYNWAMDTLKLSGSTSTSGSPDTHIELTSNAATDFSGTIDILSPRQSTYGKLIKWDLVTSNNERYQGMGKYGNGSNLIDGFRLSLAGGQSFDLLGSIEVYGGI